MFPKGLGQAMEVHVLHPADMTKARPPAGPIFSCATTSAVASSSPDSVLCR